MSNLVDAIDALVATDWRQLPGPALLDEIAELDQQLNRLTRVYLDALEAADRTGVTTSAHGSSQAFARERLHRSGSEAHRDVHLARDLADSLPLTAGALGRGAISMRHAQLIAALIGVIDAEVLGRIEQHLVEVAERADVALLRRAIAHVKEIYRPERDKAADDQDDFEARTLQLGKGLYGTGFGNWTLHPVGQELVETAIASLSRPLPGDDRTAGQRRADALVELSRRYLDSGDAPTVGGVRPHVTVVVPAETMAGQPGDAATYSHGATSTGLWARRVGCNADIARVVFAAVGEVLDAGRAIRLFTPAQRRAMIVRDGPGCIWPGCGTPHADAHHRVHWAAGGVTSVDNGVLLCGYHHDRLHLYGNNIMRQPDGSFTVDLRPGSDPSWTGPVRWPRPATPANSWPDDTS